jgi:hypothetical protein
LPNGLPFYTEVATYESVRRVVRDVLIWFLSIREKAIDMRIAIVFVAVPIDVVDVLKWDRAN